MTMNHKPQDITVRKLAPGEILEIAGRLVFKAPHSPSWGVFRDGRLMVDISPFDHTQMFSIWPQKYVAQARAEVVKKGYVKYNAKGENP